MSTAVLRIRNPNGSSEPISYPPKAKAQETEMQDILRTLSDGEPPGAYAYLEAITAKSTAKAQRDEDHSSKGESNSNSSGNKWLLAAAAIVIGLIVIGAVVGYLYPGPGTGIILPVGIGLWWLLYKIADRADQRA
jgi:hypothetical protein